MMKYITYISIILISLLSCKVQKVDQVTMCGTFYKLHKGNDFNTSYTLQLNTDNTFLLLLNTAGGKPQCKGKWEIVDSIYIILKCDKVSDVTETLTNGYMKQREYKMQIISQNKIRYNEVVLKRKKN